ncbi:MAG TPA: hypothetical protein VJ596_12820, partial [Gemmatimonadaceae bacterium]|nr:hypothetical protein [Gemmatimonadaceae bacterium]
MYKKLVRASRRVGLAERVAEHLTLHGKSRKATDLGNARLRASAHSAASRQEHASAPGGAD